MRTTMEGLPLYALHYLLGNNGTLIHIVQAGYVVYRALISLIYGFHCIVVYTVQGRDP